MLSANDIVGQASHPQHRGLTPRSTGPSPAGLRPRRAGRLTCFVRPQNPVGRGIQSKRSAGALRRGLAVSALVSGNAIARAIAPGARRLSWSECAPGRNSRCGARRRRARWSAWRSWRVGARRREVRRHRSCSILPFGAAFTDARRSPLRFGCRLRSPARLGPHLRPNPALNRTGRYAARF